jgi:hypothetical protein
MMPVRVRRLAGPLVGVALQLAPSPATLSGSVEVRPEPAVVAAGDTANIQFRMLDPNAVLLGCTVERVPCVVGESGSSASVTSPIPADAGPGPVTLGWTASVVLDPVEGPGTEKGTLQLVIGPPRFTVTAEPSAGPPETPVRVSFLPVDPAVQIQGCSASFPGTAPVACIQTPDGWSAAVVVPHLQAGQSQVNWALTYAAGFRRVVHSVVRPANGQLPFRVLGAVVTRTPTPPSRSPISPPTGSSGSSGSRVVEASSPTTAITTVGGNDGVAGWVVLALLLPLAGLLYAVRRAQARKPGAPEIRAHSRVPRVSAESVFDRPVHSVRVAAHRDRTGPRVEVRPRSPRSPT